MVRDMVQLLQDEDFTSRMTAINELSSELETDEESVAMGTAQNLNLDVSGVGSSSFDDNNPDTKTQDGGKVHVDEPAKSKCACVLPAHKQASVSIASLLDSGAEVVAATAVKPMARAAASGSATSTMLLSEDDKVWKDPGANNASNKCDVDPKRVMEVSAALLRKQWHHPASKQVQFTQVTASLLCDECTHCQVNAGSSIPIKVLGDDFHRYMHTAYHLWMEWPFLASFGSLVNHYLHSGMLNCGMSKHRMPNHGMSKSSILVVLVVQHHTGSIGPSVPVSCLKIPPHISIVKVLVYE